MAAESVGINVQFVQEPVGLVVYSNGDRVAVCRFHLEDESFQGRYQYNPNDPYAWDLEGPWYFKEGRGQAALDFRRRQALADTYRFLSRLY